jgi:predicted RNA-binding Zn ribbon-like protein
MNDAAVRASVERLGAAPAEGGEDAGRPKPAPPPLAMLQDFVNTGAPHLRAERLTTAEALREWLVARGLLRASERVSPGDLQWALEVRDALRSVLAANDGGEMDLDAIRVLNRAAARTRIVLRFGDAAGRLEVSPEADGLDGALGEILAVGFTSAEQGTWQRLKICRNERCGWAFYDRSKNRAGMWCSMAECGSRMKARAYRERRRAAS